MMKALSSFILFMLIATTLTHAEVYRCGEADGVIIFTDNPANFSSACREEIVSDIQPSRISPAPPAKAVKARVSTQLPATTTEQNRKNNTDSYYDALKREIETLIGNFVSTRKRVFRSTGSRGRNRAQRELKDIRLQKNLLSSKIDQSTIKGWQKKELQTTLSSISD